jgi:hypothetical protein
MYWKVNVFSGTFWFASLLATTAGKRLPLLVATNDKAEENYD